MQWLRDKYKDLSTLADAWAQTPEELGSFDSIPLPSAADLTYERYGNPRQVRAVDYNLFAQDMFSRWVQSMVAVIRQSGSSQLIDVGQDEGGVTNRVLNQFYGLAGVSFTTNHTYWQDDALLWDSLAAKRPGHAEHHGRNRLSTSLGPRWSMALRRVHRACRSPNANGPWASPAAALEPCSGIGLAKSTSACSAATARPKYGSP